MSALSSEPAVDPGLAGALIGRQFELKELVAGLADAQDGHGRLFLLSGDAGIGKTRLAEALAERAEPTEVLVRWGRCWEGGGAPPYWPWTQILRAELADVDLLSLGSVGPYLAQLVPELSDRLPDLDRSPAADLPSVRAALFDAVVSFLHDRSARAPMLLILDDLHAADDASLRLLHAVARELSSCHILVVGTYRDPEVRSSAVLHQRMSALARLGRRVAMSGLDEDAVATLLERAPGLGGAGTATARATELARHVHHLTDGNPFFVQEVARLLVAEQQLGRTAEVRVPEEVHALIRRRLQPVADELRELLTVAAVLGREFDLTVLAHLADQERAELLDALHHAADLDVVEEFGLGGWRFSHSLLTEALYDEVRPSRRVALHRRAGEAIEKIQGESERAQVAQLAHHFFEAARIGDGTKAVHYCAQAGQQALDALAFEEAAALFRRALEALALTSPVDERRRFELLMALGAAQERAGDLPVARDTYQRALKSARALASPELLARAAIAYTGFAESAPDDSRTSVLEEALVSLPSGDSPLRARVLALLGHRVQTQRFVTPEMAWSNLERGRRLAWEGVEMARRVGDDETLRAVLWDWHFAATPFLDTLEQRLQVADELVELAQRSGDRERLVLARQRRAFDLYALGDIEAMASEIGTARREAELLRMPFLLWGVVMEEAGLALLRGQLDDAERLAREALAHGERAEFYDAEGAFVFQLAAIRRHQGRGAEVEPLLRRIEEQKIGARFGCVGAGLAWVAIWSGRKEEARRGYEEMLPGLAPDRLVRAQVCCIVEVADLAWTLSATKGADELHAALAPHAGRHLTRGVANYSLGAADRYLAQMSTLLGRYDEAEASFEAAHRLHARLGSPLWDAYTRADHGRMLLLRGGTGDRRRAEELIHEARRGFRALGMALHEERAAALLDHGASPASDAPAVPALDRARLSLEGEYWAFEYGGTVTRLRDSKGVRYLAHLLRHPGQEHHALDLVSGDGLRGARSGDAGAVLDRDAKAAYRRRLEDLREELDEATAFNDLGRAERAQEEMDRLITELSRAVGLGGRDRKAASEAERARQSVTRAVKGTVERLADADGALGEHLRSTVRTGVYSAYVPDPRAPIVWEG